MLTIKTVSENKPSKKDDPATKRILVLDDEDTIRHMLQTTLEMEGFQVKSGKDGNSILAVCRQFKPHLIVSDVMMPNGGGFELLRSLQSDPDTSRIPVVLISGHGFDGSTRKMMELESNVVAFLTKPLRMPQFLGEIHKRLNTMSREEKAMLERSQFNIDIKKFEDRF